jgi:hypothetical protein
MTLQKGWINRQFARVERDAQKWPDWMRRETELRQQAKVSAGLGNQKTDAKTVKSAAKSAGDA